MYSDSLVQRSTSWIFKLYSFQLGYVARRLANVSLFTRLPRLSAGSSLVCNAQRGYQIILAEKSYRLLLEKSLMGV